MALSYLAELFLTCFPARPLRSADQLLLLAPCTRSARRGDAFSAFAPKLWNFLLLYIRSLCDTFKVSLLKHIYLIRLIFAANNCISLCTTATD